MKIGDYGFLFSNTQSESTTNGFGMLSGQLSDYASIRNGSYRRVVSAYYDKQSGRSESPLADTLNKNDRNSVNSRIKSAASELADAAEALTLSGSKSLFTEKNYTTKDKDGNTVTEYGYDMEAIYKAVNRFAESYNKVIEDGGNSDSNSVLSKVLHMTTQTSLYGSKLGEIGITIGSDNKLSVDEETIKNADVSRIKALFGESSSYGASISTKASMLELDAQAQLARSSFYNSSGSYSYGLQTGTNYNSFW